MHGKTPLSKINLKYFVWKLLHYAIVGPNAFSVYASAAVGE